MSDQAPPPGAPGDDELRWPSPEESLRRARVADLDEERKRAVLRFLGGAFLAGVALIVIIAVLFA